MLDTDITELIARQAEAIQSAWLQRAIKAFPAQSHEFLVERDNAFANPTGTVLKQGIHSLFEWLAAGASAVQCKSALEPIVRLLAVQESRPSESLAFIADLKGIVHAELPAQWADADARERMQELEARIDQLQLLAFDIYLEYRERLFTIRLNEMRRLRS